jgi:hypothetical protein
MNKGRFEGKIPIPACAGGVNKNFFGKDLWPVFEKKEGRFDFSLINKKIEESVENHRKNCTFDPQLFKIQ